MPLSPQFYMGLNPSKNAQDKINQIMLTCKIQGEKYRKYSVQSIYHLHLDLLFTISVCFHFYWKRYRKTKKGGESSKTSQGAVSKSSLKALLPAFNLRFAF